MPGWLRRVGRVAAVDHGGHGARGWCGLGLAGLLVLLLLAAAGCGEKKQLQLGDLAPDFSAVDQHGNPFRMADHAGKPVIIRFWSVDCKYCRADTPVFNEYYRKYREQGLMIIYISRGGEPETVRRFIEDLEIEFPVLIDQDDRIAKLYRVKLDPMAVFISPDHRLTAAVLGGVGEDELQRLIGGYLLPLAAEAGVEAEAGAGAEAAAAVAPPPVENVGPREKCPVCGMFVARYTEWITQLHLTDGKVHFFDGMKDLLAYYFQPEKFGGKTDGKVSAIWAKDYYTLQWINGHEAYYVIGSGVHGPMGHEFIPLDSEEKARTFLREHKGEKILRFNEISSELVEELRGGQRMGLGN